jgi:hypothetical protein
MDIRESKTCLVIGCKHEAETTWEPLMHSYGHEVPVCWHHYKLRLWYRGCVFCRDEEAE